MSTETKELENKGTIMPHFAYQDGGEVHFFDENRNEIPWHKSFPRFIPDVRAFCSARDIVILR